MNGAHDRRGTGYSVCPRGKWANDVSLLNSGQHVAMGYSVFHTEKLFHNSVHVIFLVGEFYDFSSSR